LATQTAPRLPELQAARERVAGHARVTPVYGSGTLARRAGRGVWLKAENLQRTGSFKIRGAVNKLTGLDAAERAAGVIAASAGNHGQAVAWAARELGIRATIFMPQDAPMAKVDATRNYGAETVLAAGALFDDALAEAIAHAEESGATFVHAFEDEAVIAGQGTLGLELAEQLPEVDTFVLPIGGGGLAAGIAIALRALRPRVRLVGVQAGTQGEGTIADGIAVKHPGELTMSILNELLDEIVHVGDEQIAEAITLLLERSKLVVEGAGAASVAAVLGGQAGGSGDVCALLSGGNIDATLLMSVVRHGLARNGRYLTLRTSVPDHPGELLKLLQLVADQRGNIVEVNHRREGMGIGLVRTGVELTLVTRDEEHCLELCSTLAAAGYEFERIR
jgi:threonine dehydratase